MRIALVLCAWSLSLFGPAAFAQTTVGRDESVRADSPEGWAMRYFAGTTLLTSFGEGATLAPWRWNAALELGNIPRLTDDQQRVGFGGVKQEDLNKSPVFGRLRLSLGLPEDWIAELGYTPPLEIAGSRARNVLALAIGRRVFENHALTLAMRGLGQVGKVQGDITCPARLAGPPDRDRNPYGCRAPSEDVFTTNYYGVDATLGWGLDEWKWHASAGVARTRLSVQVDAQLLAGRDRSHLTSTGNLPWFTLGVRRELAPWWSLAVELLYVPLQVRRPPDFALDADPLGSVRVQLRYSP